MREQCEYAPSVERGRYEGADPEACPNEATLSVGTKDNWHLCASCAALPRFSRYGKTTLRALKVTTTEPRHDP